jgi:hypothetical protein
MEGRREGEALQVARERSGGRDEREEGREGGGGVAAA